MNTITNTQTSKLSGIIRPQTRHLLTVIAVFAVTLEVVNKAAVAPFSFLLPALLASIGLSMWASARVAKSNDGSFDYQPSMIESAIGAFLLVALYWIAAEVAGSIFPTIAHAGHALGYAVVALGTFAGLAVVEMLFAFASCFAIRKLSNGTYTGSELAVIVNLQQKYAGLTGEARA